MRADLLPFCPTHFAKMVPAELRLKIGADWLSTYCYTCDQAGCQYRYSTIHGYFRNDRGPISRDLSLWVPCPKDEVPMYISKVEASHHLWLCGQDGCQESREQLIYTSVPSSARARKAHAD